jgi:hypothetical protein
MNEELRAALDAVVRAAWLQERAIRTEQGARNPDEQYLVETRAAVIAAEAAVVAIFEQERVVAKQLAEALRDMKAGWEYIRKNHGDLYGVGWERCAKSSEAALTAYDKEAK